MRTHLWRLQLDDGWAAVQRDAATGRQVAVKRKFPSGIRHVADRLHALGMKFGLYTALAAQTCGGRKMHPSLHLLTVACVPASNAWGCAALCYAARPDLGRSVASVHGRRWELRPRGARRHSVRQLDGRLRKG